MIFKKKIKKVKNKQNIYLQAGVLFLNKEEEEEEEEALGTGNKYNLLPRTLLVGEVEEAFEFNLVLPVPVVVLRPPARLSRPAFL
jgi:hypothetical protein